VNDAQARLERLLGGTILAPLRKRLRQRYEIGRRNDAFTLTGLSGDERRALEGLLARPARGARSMRLSVAELDAALARAGLAATLSDALARLDGPIRDRIGERTAAAARWSCAFAACRNPRLAVLANTANGRGLVKRLAGGDVERGRELLQAAERILQHLPRPGVPLSHLAAEMLGDAHALDEGRPVATVTLAALRAGVAERPREVWASQGVLVGELAAPALALNLTAHTGTAAGALAEQARTLGEPVHLSLRALLRAPPRWLLRDRSVFVCENPAVVAMAADRSGSCAAPLVCTDGMPSAAQRTLLAQLHEAGAELRYHGDFDWAGIAIGNYVMRTFGAKPWRFRARDYAARSPRNGRRLDDVCVTAEWDADLDRTMRDIGLALEEEAVIDLLLADLTSSWSA
jgi:uncharacterized protein (TIGR02679 family)